MAKRVLMIAFVYMKMNDLMTRHMLMLIVLSTLTAMMKTIFNVVMAVVQVHTW